MNNGRLHHRSIEDDEPSELDIETQITPPANNVRPIVTKDRYRVPRQHPGTRFCPECPSHLHCDQLGACGRRHA